jgi:nucleotide-binding universal stress UspA family protein
MRKNQMRVVLAIDESLSADAELDYLLTHSFPKQTEFRLVHAVQPSDVADRLTSMYGQSEQHEILVTRMRAAEEKLERLATEFARTLRANVSVHVACGDAVQVVVDEAKIWQADTIIVAAHRREGLARLVPGGPSVDIATYAPCSVVLVRLPFPVDITGNRCTAAK